MPTLPSYLVNFTDPITGKFIVPAFSTDGSIFPTIEIPLDPSAVNANSSILIYGKGAPNYGERIAEDLLHTLENFYGATEPVHAVSGQLWFASVHYWFDNVAVAFYRFDDVTQTWLTIPGGDITITPSAPIGDPGAGEKYWFDSSSQTLYIWNTDFTIWQPRLYTLNSVPPVDGVDFPVKRLLVCQNKFIPGTQSGPSFSARWKQISGIPASPTPPANPNIGDLWYDTTVPQLKIWSGLAWDSVADRYVLKSGDTMTGFLTLNADPVNPLHAATMQYVDAAIIAGGDGTVTGGSLNTGTGDLSITLSVGGPVIIPNIAAFNHTHPATDITFIPVGFISSTNVQAAITELENEKAPLDNPTFTTGVTLVPTTTVLLGRDPLVPFEAATKQYVDAALGFGAFTRIVRSVDTTTLAATYTAPSYVVEANELWVYLNGIKQIQGGRGQQQVLLTTGDPGTPTGLEDSIVGVTTGAPGFGAFIINTDQTSLYTGGISIEVTGSMGFSHPIIAVTTGGPGLGFFVVQTDVTSLYIPGIIVNVTGSTGNDGAYTVTSSTYALGPDETTINVAEAVGNPIPDGVIGANNDGTYTVALGGSTYSGDIDPIVGVVSGGPGLGSFDVATDRTAVYITGFVFTITGSTGNDGTYTVSAPGSTFGLVTTIPVDEAVPSATADGSAQGPDETIIYVNEDVPDPVPVGTLGADYDTSITVDGGAPQLFTFNGTTLVTYSDILSNINAGLLGAEVVMNPDGILVISDSTGALSSILITDGAPRPLFGSTSGFIAINPAVAGFSGGYQEDGTAGLPSTSVTFTPAPGAGSTIEFMVFRRV